jgi:hypothetical protein
MKSPLVARIRHWEDPVIVLIGLQLLAAPWMIDYQTDVPAAVNAQVAGAALAIVGVCACLRYRAWLQRLAAAISLWLLVSPFALGFVNVKSAMLNAGIAGAAVLLLSILTLSSKLRREQPWSKADFN